MAEVNKSTQEYENKVGHEQDSVENLETKDRGLFGFIGKKDGEKKPQQHQNITTEYDEKVKISEAQQNKSGLLDKLHRPDIISPNSPSDYENKGIEEEENKEKKGLVQEIKKKIAGDDKKEEDRRIEDTNSFGLKKGSDEKKGLIEKTKEKLPTAGQNKKCEEEHHLTHAPPHVVPESNVKHHLTHAPPHVVPESNVKHHLTHAPPHVVPESNVIYNEEGEAKEKSLLDKIKEKIPGHHPKTEDEKEKEKVKEMEKEMEKQGKH